MQTIVDTMLVCRSTKPNVCLQVEERLLLLIMAEFVKEEEDEFLWTNQDPQHLEAEYMEEELHVLEAKQRSRG